MIFSADFHIHSRFSRATSKTLDFEKLYIAAQLKGITVVGTGDFTHPKWFAEIEKKLEPAEPGLFRLKKEIAQYCDEVVPLACHQKVRFILVTEISCIYKKNDKTRKNHNLIFLPDLHAVERFNSTLDKVGNIQSDGRPILGLDAKDLLDILLNTDDNGFLVPAHIWTPWFSVLGSKSGFDTIDECFEDLTPHIYAVETGLSSDPPMNWRVSSLDRFTLISNSDAHSPNKLGREANLFNTDLSYFSIHSSIRSGNPDDFIGTVEFFPEEGKYHLDGHRKCNIRMQPKETLDHQGNCPECGKPLTLGVLYRVEALSDRPENYQPVNRPSYTNLVPLNEVLSEILGFGPATKRVKNTYRSLLERFGSEFNILLRINDSELEENGIPLLGEAIKRMRQGQISLSPGYDGLFGSIKLFEPGEREKLMGQSSLFSNEKTAIKPPRQKNFSNISNLRTKPSDSNKNNKEKGLFRRDSNSKLSNKVSNSVFDILNDEQRQAVTLKKGPAIIVAGPGTGKTYTLTRRIAFLINQKKIPAEKILAITFTNKAAEEMQRRLNKLLGPAVNIPYVATFHAFCFDLLREMFADSTLSIVDDAEKNQWMAWALKMALKEGGPINRPVREIVNAVATAKQNLLSPDEYLRCGEGSPTTRIVTTVYRNYNLLLSLQHRCDYEDLIYKVVKILENDIDKRLSIQKRFDHILVDEYQDLNYGQYRLIQQLSPSGRKLFVIGDPNQSIYGFRGSDYRYFNQFLTHFPEATITRLSRNYRSTQTILKAANQIISHSDSDNLIKDKKGRIYSGIEGKKTISIIETRSDRAEAVAIGKQIENLMGGIGFHSVDFGGVDGSTPSSSYGFSDFAVLFRTRSQGETIARTMQKAGIPFQNTSKELMIKGQGAIFLVSWLKVIEGVGSFLDLERLITGFGLPIRRSALDRFIEWAVRRRIDLTEALYRVVKIPLKGLKRDDQVGLADFSGQIQSFGIQIKHLEIQYKLKYLFDQLPVGYTNKNPDVINDYKWLINLAGEESLTSADFINKFDLQTDTDLYDKRSQKVALLTMHAAKGLEFPVVFVSGCETDLIPLKPKDGHMNNLAEERRLFYVAMTRAKERLYLTYALKRRVFGRYQRRRPSIFIDHIDRRLKSNETASYHSAFGQSQRKGGQVQLKLF